MSAFVLVLVLCSALIHATWNLWIKQIGTAARGRTVAWLLTALSAAIYAPVAAVYLALGSWRPTWAALPWVVASSVIHATYFLVLLRGYRSGDLSLVYPTARGTGPLWASLGAVLLLGERPTPLSVTGALLVAAGVLVLTLRPNLRGEERFHHGLRWGLLTGVLIGLYVLVDGAAVRHAGLPPLLFYSAGEVVRVAMLAPLAVGDRPGLVRLWGEHRLRLIAIAVFSPLSYIIVLVAMRQGEISHIAPAREVSILIGAWLGARVLGEGERRRRLVAAAAFGLGVAALALS